MSRKLSAPRFIAWLPLLALLGVACSVGADEWALPLEGVLCRDHMRVAADGKSIVFLERATEQPPEQKGPPVPPNAVILAFDLDGKMTRQRLGKRDTAKNVYPVFCEPAAGGRWLATLVNRKIDALDPAGTLASLLFVVNRQEASSRQIAADIDHFFWSSTDGDLVVSFQRDDKGMTRPVRRYDPESSKWTDSTIHGACWAESDDGRLGLYTVALDSVNRPTTYMQGEGKTHLAVLDRSGRVVRAFNHVADLVDTPCLSPNGKFVASSQFRLGQPSGADRFVAILSVESGEVLSVPGHREVLGVTNGGDAIVLDFNSDFNGGRPLGVLKRDGRIDSIAKKALVGATNGKDVFYVAADAPRVLRSRALSDGPVELFPTDDNYLDSISADKYLDSIENQKNGPAPDAYALSSQQRELHERLGYPELFTIRFIEETIGRTQIRCRSESWVYVAAQMEFEFLDGECIATKKLAIKTNTPTVITNNPTQFVMGMSEQHVRELLGLSDFKPLRLAETGVEDLQLKQVSLWANDCLLLGFGNNRLVQVQSLSKPLPKQ